jgi:hypothetical protein
MNCDDCKLQFKHKGNCENLENEDASDTDTYYSLTIKSETLARLIQRQQLSIADLHCMDSSTKQFIQGVLLQCILCKTVQSKMVNSNKQFNSNLMSVTEDISMRKIKNLA